MRQVEYDATATWPLQRLISKETKMPCKIIDDPLTAVVRGAGIALENIDTLSEVMSKDEDDEALF